MRIVRPCSSLNIQEINIKPATRTVSKRLVKWYAYIDGLIGLGAAAKHIACLHLFLC